MMRGGGERQVTQVAGHMQEQLGFPGFQGVLAEAKGRPESKRQVGIRPAAAADVSLS